MVMVIVLLIRAVMLRRGVQSLRDAILGEGRLGLARDGASCQSFRGLGGVLLRCFVYGFGIGRESVERT